MRPLALALLALVLLPAAATAKGVSAAKLCGADGCEAVRGNLDALTMGGEQTSRPPEPLPFFRARLVASHAGEVLGRFTMVVVPKAERLMADDGMWMTMPPETAAAYARATRGRTPFAPSRMPRGQGWEAPTGAAVDAVYTAPASTADGGGGFPWWTLALLVPVGMVARRAVGAHLFA